MFARQIPVDINAYQGYSLVKERGGQTVDGRRLLVSMIFYHPLSTVHRPSKTLTFAI